MFKIAARTPYPNTFRYDHQRENPEACNADTQPCIALNKSLAVQ